MDFKPSPKQALALWGLFFTAQEPMISKWKPALTAKERREIEAAGLIELVKRGRAKHVRLTEQAWTWAPAHLDDEISPSRFAAEALAGLLAALKRSLELRKLNLKEFLVPLAEAEAGPVVEAGIEAGVERPAALDLAERIREAYLQASGGQSNVRVRLFDLVRLLPDVAKPRLDAELLAMQRQQRYGLVLWSLDDPWDIGVEDDRAAVDLGGVKRHIVYMEA
ncbi:MAG: hypothetical protein AB1641_21865 [Thermodesulfobacteriota bacterium]